MWKQNKKCYFKDSNQKILRNIMKVSRMYRQEDGTTQSKLADI